MQEPICKVAKYRGGHLTYTCLFLVLIPEEQQLWDPSDVGTATNGEKKNCRKFLESLETSFCFSASSNQIPDNEVMWEAHEKSSLPKHYCSHDDLVKTVVIPPHKQKNR